MEMTPIALNKTSYHIPIPSDRSCIENNNVFIHLYHFLLFVKNQIYPIYPYMRYIFLRSIARSSPHGNHRTRTVFATHVTFLREFDVPYHPQTKVFCCPSLLSRQPPTKPRRYQRFRRLCTIYYRGRYVLPPRVSNPQGMQG